MNTFEFIAHAVGYSRFVGTNIKDEKFEGEYMGCRTLTDKEKDDFNIEVNRQNIMANLHREAIIMNRGHDRDQENQKMQDELFSLLPVGLQFNYIGIEFGVFKNYEYSNVLCVGENHYGGHGPTVKAHYMKHGVLLEKEFTHKDIEWLSLAIKDTSK